VRGNKKIGSAWLIGLLSLNIGICGAGFLIARTDNQCSNKNNHQYNSNFFHTDIILLEYKNILFSLKTINVPI